MVVAILLLALVVPALAVNEYHPIPQMTPAFGTVQVTVRCQHNLFSQEMILTSHTYDESMSVWLNPNGRWDTELIPGTYTLELLDGNAGHPESAVFTIRSGQVSYVNFIGHAMSQRGSGDTDPCTPWPECKDNPTPTPTPTPVPTPTVTPTVTPTPTETPVPDCYWNNWTEEIYHPAVTHLVCHSPTIINHDGLGFCDVVYVGYHNGNYKIRTNMGMDWRYLINGVFYKWTGQSGDYDITCYPFPCTVIVDQEAWTEYIYHTEYICPS